MPQVDAEFELMIGPFNGPDRVTVECALTSPALDPAMHQGASLAVEIDARRETVEGRWSDSGPGFALEAFHLQSLLEYLRIQDYIREILEREMARDQEEVDDQGDPVRGEVWEWARVELLELRSRDVHSPEMIKQLHKAGRTEAEIGLAFQITEPRETKTIFVVHVGCDWSHHPREVTFRNGKFAGIEAR